MDGMKMHTKEELMAMSHEDLVMMAMGMQSMGGGKCKGGECKGEAGKCTGGKCTGTAAA